MKAKRRVAARVYSGALIGAAWLVVGPVVAAAASIMVPLFILNIASGIVAGVWLAFLGQWYAIFQGIVLGAIGHWLISLLLIPGFFLFGMPGVLFEEKGKKLPAYFFVILSQIYLGVIVTLWCVGTLRMFTQQADESSLIPMLLWSYDTALAPLVFLARCDFRAGNERTFVVVFFAAVGLAILILLILFSKPTLFLGYAVFALIMCVSVVLQVAVAIGSDIVESRLMASDAGLSGRSLDDRTPETSHETDEEREADEEQDANAVGTVEDELAAVLCECGGNTTVRELDALIAAHLGDDLKQLYPKELYYLRLNFLRDYVRWHSSSMYDNEEADDWYLRHRYDLPEELPILHFCKHILQHHVGDDPPVEFDEEALRRRFAEVHEEYFPGSMQRVAGSWLRAPWRGSVEHPFFTFTPLAETEEAVLERIADSAHGLWGIGSDRYGLDNTDADVDRALKTIKKFCGFLPDGRDEFYAEVRGGRELSVPGRHLEFRRSFLDRWKEYKWTKHLISCPDCHKPGLRKKGEDRVWCPHCQYEFRREEEQAAQEQEEDLGG